MLRTGVRVGLDIGKVRTGIARSDAGGTIAFAHAVVPTEHLEKELQTLISEYSPIVFYVGLPIDLRGQVGIAAQEIQDVVKSVFNGVDTPVVFTDERMTTKIAESRLRSLEQSHRDMRSTIDAMAAIVLLEDALDRERSTVEHE
jgi:putative Holliday junction resolvase